MNKGRHSKKTAPRRSRRGVAAIAATVLLLTLVVGGTIAFLMDKTDPVVNVFDPTDVSSSVEESFDGTTKSNVVVRNTGKINAYIRVAVVMNNMTFNEDGTVKGVCGQHPVSKTFTPGKNWVKYGNYYYYTLPVKAGETTATPLISSIELAGVEGCCKMQVEVIASAIQAEPATAVQQAWKVNIAPNSVTAYSAG